MKTRILLSAVIGAVVAVILYPTADVAARLTVFAVSFFLLLGILFCTMLIGAPDEARKQKERDRAPATEENKREGTYATQPQSPEGLHDPRHGR